DGIRDRNVTGVQTCALPIFLSVCNAGRSLRRPRRRRRAVQFAKMNGNLFVTPVRNGRRSSDCRLIITTASKTKRGSFWASALNQIGRASCRERGKISGVEL